jgi:hypothetical protein
MEPGLAHDAVRVSENRIAQPDWSLLFFDVSATFDPASECQLRKSDEVGGTLERGGNISRTSLSQLV